MKTMSMYMTVDSEENKELTDDHTINCHSLMMEFTLQLGIGSMTPWFFREEAGNSKKKLELLQQTEGITKSAKMH